MHIHHIGEFALIERLAALVKTSQEGVIVGIGDDVAVLRTEEDGWLLATVDSQVEGVHFLREVIPPYRLGRKALAINMSDIAAVGGKPTFALVSLFLPSELEVAWVEDLYRGLRDEAERNGVAIVGGNMARLPDRVIIDVTLLGTVVPEVLLLRSGAQPGDRVLVTGTLGDAAAGLHLILHPEVPVAEADRAYLLDRHFTPTPRLAEARVIAESRLATAMIDISDGLSSDLGHICKASHVGVRLWAERLPISQEARRVAKHMGRPAWELALTGGEDYELCFTVPAEAVTEIQHEVETATHTPVVEVGEVLPPEAGQWLILPDGRQVPLSTTQGWQHF